jgi:hypothetical protein
MNECGTEITTSRYTPMLAVSPYCNNLLHEGETAVGETGDNGLYLLANA